MSNERPTPIGEEKWQRPQRPAAPAPEGGAPEAPAQDPEAPARPATTGDMQETGATAPEEVKERREETDGEAPVHENPGDQNSG